MSAVESASDAQRGLQTVTTSFYGAGGDGSIVQHVHLKWDATFVGTYTFWSCDFPSAEVLVGDVVDGNWIQENPPTGYTAISPAGAATAATPLVIDVPGGTAGGASVHVGNLGSKRLRVRCVCGTAGQTRIRTNGKS